MDNVTAGKVLIFIESPEGYALQKQWAIEREAIISKCKNAKLEEKRALGLQELVGFDKAIQILHNIANYKEQEEQVIED